MWKDAYTESRVLSADAVGLVCLVYGHAIDSVRESRGYLAAGDILARSQAVSRAIAALAELEGSLDHAAGGDVSRSLAELYRYIRQRLTEGNMRQTDGPLAEAESLLKTLAEGWNALRAEGAGSAETPVCVAPQVGAWVRAEAGSAHIWNA